MANDTSNRLAGTAFLTVDGQTYMVAGAFEYCPSTLERETLTGMDSVHGYSEKPTPGFIAATLRDSGGLSVAQINLMRNVTVVCELANNKVIIGRNMWSVEKQSAKAEDATIETRWEGPSVTEN